MNKQTFQLDPDFRKNPDVSKPFCVRCQKPVNQKSAVSVTVDWSNWEVSKGGVELIGNDCWKVISKKEQE